MYTITIKWLRKNNACSDARWEFKEKTNGEVEATKLLKLLIKNDRLDWANWLIVRVMTRPQYLAYGIFAAEQVLNNFEKEFPKDKRPLLAIEAAKEVLEHDTKENRSAAESAARSAARSAESAAEFAARSAARSAESAAWSAAWSAARSAAWSAAWSAESAAWSAESAARSAAKRNIMKIKILKYGIKLLKEGE